jgi:hypothetical protein
MKMKIINMNKQYYVLENNNIYDCYTIQPLILNFLRNEIINKIKFLEQINKQENLEINTKSILSFIYNWAAIKKEYKPIMISPIVIFNQLIEKYLLSITQSIEIHSDKIYIQYSHNIFKNDRLEFNNTTFADLVDKKSYTIMLSVLSILYNYEYINNKEYKSWIDWTLEQ